MPDRANRGPKHYRVELSGPGAEPAPAMEFAADGPETLLHAAARHASGRTVTIFEDGRPLASLRHATHGFWTIEPRRPARP